MIIFVAGLTLNVSAKETDTSLDDDVNLIVFIGTAVTSEIAVSNLETLLSYINSAITASFVNQNQEGPHDLKTQAKLVENLSEALVFAAYIENLLLGPLGENAPYRDSWSNLFGENGVLKARLKLLVGSISQTLSSMDTHTAQVTLGELKALKVNIDNFAQALGGVFSFELAYFDRLENMPLMEYQLNPTEIGYRLKYHQLKSQLHLGVHITCNTALNDALMRQFGFEPPLPMAK